MKQFTTLSILLLALFFGCKKDVTDTSPPETIYSKIEGDTLFIEWGKAANGRWINYSFEKIDKRSINKENVFQVLNSSIKQVYTARKYYEILLYAKYGNVENLKGYLDSLFRKNYYKISSSLERRSVMDELYSKYGKITLPRKRASVNAHGKISWGDNDLDEVVISACGIPNDLVNFYNIFIVLPVFPITPWGANQQVVDCRTDALDRVSGSMAGLKNAYSSGWECAMHRDEAYQAMMDFFDCDPLNPYDGYSPFDPYAPGGGGEPAFSLPQWENNFNKKIDTSALADCFKKALKAILSQNNHMASIVKGFSTTLPQFPGQNWKLQTGPLPPNTNGLTTNYDRTNSRVVTTFDPSKFTGATDLAVVRTLLHESAHAYLVAYFRNDPINANKDYGGLMQAYVNRNGDLNQAHHDEFVSSFVLPIYEALMEYGNSKGYTFSSVVEGSQYYLDLAWGGLTTTSAFIGLSPSIKNRILDTLTTEQFGTDRLGNPKSQKGGFSGC